MAFIPAQNGNGGSGSNLKVAIGEFTASGSEQRIYLEYTKTKGEHDFTPSYLFVYRLSFPNDNWGSGSHFSFLDETHYPNYSPRVTYIASLAANRTPFPTPSGGYRLYDVGKGYFDFSGGQGYQYAYVAVGE